MLRNAVAPLLLLSCSLLPGCGTTGGTNAFVLDLDPALRAQAGANVRIGSVGMENWGAAHLVAVAVYQWGKFSEADLGNVERSLRDTLTANTAAAARRSAGEVEIHLVVRGYIVATSNMGGAVLASLAWAGVDAGGTVIHREQFYAADSVMIIGTIGRLKDSVHQAVVRRIASRALALASAQPLPSAFPNTYDHFEEAVSKVPEHMISRGNAELAGLAGFLPPSAGIPLGIVGVWRVRGIQRVEWKLVDPSADFDWAGYLARLKETR